MIFIDNKYTNCYYKIINKAKSRISCGYTENHHIIKKGSVIVHISIAILKSQNALYTLPYFSVM